MIEAFTGLNPGFADSVLILAVAIMAITWGVLKFFAPMMASRGPTQAEERGQLQGCALVIVALIIGLWCIVEIFV